MATLIFLRGLCKYVWVKWEWNRAVLGLCLTFDDTWSHVTTFGVMYDHAHFQR